MVLRDLRTDWRTFAEFLKIVDDHQGSAWKAALDNLAISILRAEGHVVYMNRIVRTDGIDLLLTLKFHDSYLGHYNCTVENFCLSLYPAELSRAEYVARVGEGRSDANCSRL